jgi:hypothetical protein
LWASTTSGVASDYPFDVDGLNAEIAATPPLFDET